MRNAALVFTILALASSIALAGCAGIPPSAILKTPPGDYVITVNASGNVGAVAEMHSANVAVTVTQ
jgi:multidrug efflux pump subunit AcrA (membrane-fusion protein)